MMGPIQIRKVKPQGTFKDALVADKLSLQRGKGEVFFDSGPLLLLFTGSRQDA